MFFTMDFSFIDLKKLFTLPYNKVATLVQSSNCIWNIQYIFFFYINTQQLSGQKV
jgi:hypothetical protein